MAIIDPQVSRRRFTSLAAVLAATVLAAGCTALKAPPYGADYEALDRLAAAHPGKVAVARVQPTSPDDPVNSIKLRSARLVSPSGSFAQYLEDALVRDLGEVSAYDPRSTTRVAARILVNDVELGVMGVTRGSGRMDVEVVVTRGTQERLRKTYRADTTFESGYVNVVAVPAGQAAYPRLVRALLRNLYADPQFAAAVAP